MPPLLLVGAGSPLGTEPTARQGPALHKRGENNISLAYVFAATFLFRSNVSSNTDPQSAHKRPCRSRRYRMFTGFWTALPRRRLRRRFGNDFGAAKLSGCATVSIRKDDEEPPDCARKGREVPKKQYPSLVFLFFLTQLPNPTNLRRRIRLSGPTNQTRQRWPLDPPFCPPHSLHAGSNKRRGIVQHARLYLFIR